MPKTLVQIIAIAAAAVASTIFLDHYLETVNANARKTNTPEQAFTLLQLENSLQSAVQAFEESLN